MIRLAVDMEAFVALVRRVLDARMDGWVSLNGGHLEADEASVNALLALVLSESLTSWANDGVDALDGDGCHAGELAPESPLMDGGERRGVEARPSVEVWSDCDLHVQLRCCRVAGPFANLCIGV